MAAMSRLIVLGNARCSFPWRLEDVQEPAANRPQAGHEVRPLAEEDAEAKNAGEETDCQAEVNGERIAT
jgi:hypothetical protein